MTNIEFTTTIEVNAPKAKVWDALINPEQIQSVIGKQAVRFGLRASGMAKPMKIKELF